MNLKPLSLPYRYRPSKLPDSPPALFMFHGYGSNEDDLFGFAPELPEELAIFSARAPYPLQPYGYAWYAIYFDAQTGKFNDTKEAIASREKIKTFISEATKTYDLDPTNITLLGFSQGAILSYAVSLTYPNLVKNCIALSGYVDPEMADSSQLASAKSKPNFYCSHGTVDQVIPIEWARRTPEYLRTLGIQTKLNEFPVGHGVAPENLRQLKAWLQERI